MVEKKRRKERYEILFEEVNSKMDLVLEGYREFGGKFEEAKREREEIRDDLTHKIEFVATGLNKKIEDTEKRLGQRIDRVGNKQDDHERRIEVVEKKLSI
jgi:dissimilatory sulfite reductase (desulfoviridin) alpha/beta subunit